MIPIKIYYFFINMIQLNLVQIYVTNRQVIFQPTSKKRKDSPFQFLMSLLPQSFFLFELIFMILQHEAGGSTCDSI